MDRGEAAPRRHGSKLLHALVLGTLALACVGFGPVPSGRGSAAVQIPGARVARADGWTRADSEDALLGAPYMVECIVQLETGGTLDPYATGASGEQGLAQILPSWNGGGQWDAFWYGDWTTIPPEDRSTYNPYQAVWFLTQYGAEHGYSAWSTARYC